nr:EOG090X0B17 [Ilyocryptus agilis]
MRSTCLLHFFVILFVIKVIRCAPVDPKKPAKEENEVPHDNEMDDSGIEYNRYLQEVVQLLESDPDFRSKLEKSDPEDIRTGKVAKELEYVNHNVRNKLDELKRREMERLRHLAMQEYERSRGLGIPYDGRQKIPGHVDHRNPNFEVEDLRKLIVQTTKDLEEADKKRKESFKEYEMQKQFEHDAKMKEIADEEKRKSEEKAWQEAQKKHAQHPKMHHPGSKQQLEEVWEEQDHMSPDNFNPKTFFAMHDLDGNGYWDQDEVKALFSKELDKAYDPNAPEDDMAERYEEMERMREHVFNETDKNRDYLISFPEFLEQTRKQEFEQDPGWNTIDEQPVYSQQEYMEFERRRMAEIQRMIDQGLLPPHPGMMMHPPQQPIPGQYGVPHPQQAYYQPQGVAGGQQLKQLTPEEAAKLQAQQPVYGQPQFVPQPQFAQQPYAGQVPVQGQFAQQPYAGQVPVQAQYAQQPYAGQLQQGQFAEQPLQQQGYQQQLPVQQQPIQTQQQQFQQPIQQQQAQQQFQQPIQQQQAQQQVPIQQQQAQQQVPIQQQQASSAQQQDKPAAQQQQPSVKVN